MPNQGTSERGFAFVDEDRQREIARKGGQNVPDDERSFSKDRELAAEAGRKGGEHGHGGRQEAQGGDGRRDGDGHRGGGGNFAEDRERAAEAGRKGGSALMRGTQARS